MFQTTDTIDDLKSDWCLTRFAPFHSVRGKPQRPMVSVGFHEFLLGWHWNNTILVFGLLVTMVAVPVRAQNSNTPADSKPKITEIVIDGVPGYQDTPLQPDGKWHVHDPVRPQPPIVAAGTFSEKATPPGDARVLFDGHDLSQWRDQETGGPAGWKIEGGVLVAAKGDIVTTNEFGDLQLHLEFCEPEPAPGDPDNRGNSGVFLMDRYEIQIFDSYHNKFYADGAMASLYGQHPSLANACRPPGEWQTCDIAFTAPRFGLTGEVLSPGYVTVFHNGVLVQNHQAFRGTTIWRSPGQYVAHGLTGPLRLQFHNCPVRFRNIWVRQVPLVNEP